ncbi:MAG TPA: tRNA guanosine(15) transglycosylase TgtA [Thermoplasmata archaeon]|nr:tRNA guanosine(15) transglycosylase TgtA [Thermoplasmata archaeon]
MAGFEVLERDGLARLGRFDTPHGAVDTPVLLPVVHPDPDRQPIPPSELSARLGLKAVITSSYITWRTPPLRAVAESSGIHGLLRFSGPVMTDSGAFQQHAYGSVEVDADEIVDFQAKIGSDIATVLDVFTEPDLPFAEAEAALATTVERAQRARKRWPGLLAVPVQGGDHAELRARSAAAASALGDVLAVGGVVPLMEQYRFAELARALAAARPALSPGAALHLFGTGHPMTFAFAALFGVDLFDSSAYHKFARRDSLMFPEGTVTLEDIREPVCHCALCAATPLTEVRGWVARDRERHLAFHNLVMSAEEVGRVRQAIRDGTLWELAERRATAHPALRAGLAEARRHLEVFLPAEPESRRAFREVGPESRDRPAAVRFRDRVSAYRAGRGAPLKLPRVALRPEYLRHVPAEDRSGAPIHWEVPTPLGDVPLELSEVYPVGPYLGIEEFVHPPRHHPPSDVPRAVAERTELDVETERDWTDAWTDRQVDGLLSFQYGSSVANALRTTVRGERSRRSGRLRAILADEGPLFMVGTDGLPHPTFRGGKRLHRLLGAGRWRVVATDDAVPFVREGRSLFTRFVAGADRLLSPGTTALVVDAKDELLAVGRLVLAPHEMPQMKRGVAVRITAHAAEPVPAEPEEPELPAWPPESG